MYASWMLHAILVAFCVENVNAFWRMNCAHIQRGRVDPLVSPGRIAGHAHSIIGGSNIGINSTYESMVNSECTSCEITADKSAYWSPTLYYNYPNGSYLEVPHNGGVAYYLGRGPNTNQTIPFPNGLNILSGNMAARSYDNTTYTWGNATYPGRPVADRVSFACLRDNQPPEQPYMFETDCPYGMRAQIHYQSCWNGRELYKADNSHVAYQSQIDNGVCPPTHPIQIPHIFLEVLYSVANVPKEAGGHFVFAQGDPTGYGFHGDFQNGWDFDVLSEAVRDCLSVENFGTISECPVLFRHQTSGYKFNCPERPPQIGEQVTGLISKLPGCNQIVNGPAAAPMASNVCPAGSPQPSVTSTRDSISQPTAQVSPGASWGTNSLQRYVGCYNDSGAAIRTLNSVRTANYTAMTVDYCQDFCKSKGYRLSGVEWGQECWCDSGINPTSRVYQMTVGGVDGCTWNCGGTMTRGGTQQICGGLNWISIYNNTDPSFVAFGSNENSAANRPPDLPIKPLPSNYVGCATDQYQNSGRALTGASLSQLNMSSTICARFCGSSNGGRGYQFYGTEYGSQCFCGNALAGSNFLMTATSTPRNTTCSTRCTGVGDEICGGANAISLYRNTTHVAPRIKSPIGKYTQKNCLTDPNGSGGRALTDYRTTSNVMTADLCVKTCLGRRFKYAGVEYGTECYCGNTINAASGAQARTCSIGNLVLCAGDSTQYCGGSAWMNLYYSATL
ncbi:putative carbohydrate-binding WSC [Septoria linicola]|nr:putative carbohydrate-binding WSC [Septoria linicola]